MSLVQWGSKNSTGTSKKQRAEPEDKINKQMEAKTTHKKDEVQRKGQKGALPTGQSRKKCVHTYKGAKVHTKKTQTHPHTPPSKKQKKKKKKR